MISKNNFEGIVSYKIENDLRAELIVIVITSTASDELGPT